MKNIFKRSCFYALIITALLCAALFIGLNTGNKTTKSAEAAGNTTTITFAINGKSDEVDLIPGDTFVLSVHITTTRGSESDWAAIQMLVAPLSLDGLSVNTNLCKYFSWDEDGYYDNYGVDPNFAFYSDVTHDVFASNEGLYLGFAKPTNSRYIKNASIDFSVETPITISEDVKGEDFYFGILPDLDNAVGYGTGSDADRANTSSLIWNNVKVNMGTPSDVAELSEVKVGHGTASDSLTVADTMSYTGNSADLTNFMVQVTEKDKGATIKIGTSANPTTVISSGVAANVPLSTAPSTIYIDVTSEDGTNKKTYTINYTNSFVQLSNITSSGVTATTGVTKNGLSTSFSAATKTYTVYVPSDATSVNVTPTVAANAGIKTAVAVSATNCTAASTVNSGSAVSVTGVKDGSSLTLTATAADGTTTAAYTLTFQMVSVDTGISAFTMTGKDDGATYNSDPSQGVDYYFALPYEAGNYSGKFNITTSSDKASVKVGTAAYSSATVYTAGNYSVVVTAEAGNTKTYSVSVVKTVIPADFTVLKYSFSGADSYSDAKAAAEYDSTTYTFTKKINVSDLTSTTPRIYIGGTYTADATVTTTGLTANSAVTAGTNEKHYYGNLSIGTNTFTLKASSSAGSVTYTFVISYVEENNNITNIALASGTTALEGYTFNAATSTYNLNVPFSVSSVTATVTAEGSYAYVYRDSDVRLSTNTYTKTLSVGSNSFTIYAKADNGLGDKGTVYTFNISRTAADTDALLNSLTVSVDGSAVTLDPVFSPDTTNYTVKVDSDAFSATIAATSSSSLATVSGTISNQSVTLTKGTTTNTASKTVTVKSESGGTTSYTITFVREIASATFTSLGFSTTGPTSYADVFSAAEYDQATHTFTKTYNVTDISSTTPRFFIGGNVSRDATASQTGLTVNNTSGNGCTYNYYADLTIGENVFTVTATSSAGNLTYTFKISYLEQLNTITRIDLADASGAVNGFAFSAATTNYSLTVPYNTSSVTFSVTTDGIYSYVYAGSDSNKLTQNTSTLVHTLTKSLSVGENTVELYAKADKGLGDKGTVYTVKITREQVDSEATLSDLVVKIGGTPVTLSPAFSPNTFQYTITDDSGSDSLIINVEATASSSLATVTGTGQFTISPSVAGDANTSVLTVTVTAEDGSKQSYTIYVSKKPITLDNNYEINSLTIIGSDGVTYFSSSETSLSYGQMPAITVPYLVGRVTLSASTLSPVATLVGDLGNVELEVGENTVTVYAYAEDGTNSDGENKYIFTINREKAALYARLSDLQINDLRLEGFSSDSYDYVYRADSETLFVSIRAIAEEERATISVQANGITFNPATGTNYQPYVPLGDKGDTITVTITVALDDLISNYTVRITRSSDKPVLSSLQVGEYSILNGNGEVIDGKDEAVVSKMTDFYVEVIYSELNNLIVDATTDDATAEVRISGDIIKTGVGFCTSSISMKDLFNADGEVVDIQIAVIPEVGEVAVYYLHVVFLTSNTNAFITIDEIQSFNSQYSPVNPSIVYGNYVIPYTMSKLTITVEFDVEEGYAEGTYQIYYNATLKNDNGTQVSDVKLNYGVNYVLICLTSSDGRVTKTLVVLVEREQVRLETVSIDEIQQFATDYSGNQTEYFYSVGSDIENLNINVTVAEGYTFAIANQSDLKTGINQVRIYIFEKAPDTARSTASYKLTSDAIEDSALRVIYLNVFREEAATSPIWQILFYVLIGLCVLFLLIILLMLIFRRRVKETQPQPQQQPIIINTPPAAQPKPQPRPQPVIQVQVPPQPQVVQPQPQVIQPQIVQAPPQQYIQAPPQPQVIQPQVVQAPPQQYIQVPPQPQVIQPQIVQAPPQQYVQVPPQQYMQPQSQPLVQPIIINTAPEQKHKSAPINIPDENSPQPRKVIIRKDGIYDVDGFYDNAGDE